MVALASKNGNYDDNNHDINEVSSNSSESIYREVYLVTEM